MHDKGKVIVGIVIFLAVVLFPIWYSAARGGTGYAPDLEVGTDAEACVEDTDWMRASHMDLLDQWRDDVVRGEGEPYHLVAATGEEVEKSLTRTCLDCHAAKADFCDRCHAYLGVSPYCWDCHNEPGGNR